MPYKEWNFLVVFVFTHVANAKQSPEAVNNLNYSSAADRCLWNSSPNIPQTTDGLEYNHHSTMLIRFVAHFNIPSVCTYSFNIPNIIQSWASGFHCYKWLNFYHLPRYSDYHRPHTCRTNIKKFSILFQGPRIWNSLPIDIKNAPTFSMFKRMIKPFLRVRQNAT